MPIYEFECKACGTVFEELVSGDAQPPCPACHAEKCAKLPSCACHRSATSRSGSGSPYSPPSVSHGGGGCGGCAGGNCASCH